MTTKTNEPRYMNDEEELNRHFIEEKPKKTLWQKIRDFFKSYELTVEQWERLETKKYYGGCSKHHRDLWPMN